MATVSSAQRTQKQQSQVQLPSGNKGFSAPPTGSGQFPEVTLSPHQSLAALTPNPFPALHAAQHSQASLQSPQNGLGLHFLS